MMPAGSSSASVSDVKVEAEEVEPPQAGSQGLPSAATAAAPAEAAAGGEVIAGIENEWFVEDTAPVRDGLPPMPLGATSLHQLLR